ncbi:MAG: hypothetical protein EPO12_14045 [Aquabacterium sp.]|nr:MAG: hypothetical protein EPO12_14045 [Aquabacterium sp.]
MDQLRFDALVGRIYEAALAPASWGDVLRELQDSIGLDYWNLLCVQDGSPPQVLGYGGDRTSPRALQRYESHYGAIDPRLEKSRGLSVGQVLLCQQHFDERYVSRSEFYQDFLLPEGLRYLAGGLACAGDGRNYVLGLLRGADRGPFSGEDERLIQALMPHLERSLRVMDRLQQESARAGAADLLLESTHLAVIAIDRQGRLRHCNRRGESLLREAAVLCLRRGVLACADDAQQASLAAAIQSCAANGEPVTLPLRGPQGRPHGSLTLLRQAAQGGGPAQGLLCLVSALGRRRIASVRQLMDLFQLTPAEARLARAIADGEELEHYAQAADLKLSTVRTQLRAAFAKTGTRRQSELVHLIGGIPPTREPRPGGR